MHALRAIMGQALVQHAGLRRIVDRAQACRKSLQPVKPGLSDGGFGLQVFVSARREPCEIRRNKLTVVKQVRLEREQLIELGQKEVLVDGQRAEARAALGP